jgi:hypothetical protein
MNSKMLFPERLHSLDERSLQNAQACICHACLSQLVEHLSFVRPPPDKIEPDRAIKEIKCRRGEEGLCCAWTEYTPMTEDTRAVSRTTWWDRSTATAASRPQD